MHHWMNTSIKKTLCYHEGWCTCSPRVSVVPPTKLAISFVCVCVCVCVCVRVCVYSICTTSNHHSYCWPVHHALGVKYIHAVQVVPLTSHALNLSMHGTTVPTPTYDMHSVCVAIVWLMYSTKHSTMPFIHKSRNLLRCSVPYLLKLCT